jgi:hypothetical protein
LQRVFNVAYGEFVSAFPGYDVVKEGEYSRDLNGVINEPSQDNALFPSSSLLYVNTASLLLELFNGVEEVTSQDAHILRELLRSVENPDTLVVGFLNNRLWDFCQSDSPTLRELMGFCTRVASLGIALALYDRGLVDVASLQEVQSNFLYESMQMRVRKKYSYLIDDIDYTPSEEVMEQARKEADAKISDLKSKKVNVSRDGEKIVVTEWSLVEDDFAEELSEEEIEEYARKNDIDMSDPSGYRRAKFRCAGEKARKQYISQNLPSAIEIWDRDITFFTNELKVDWESLRAEETRFLLEEFVRLRNLWCEFDGSVGSDNVRQILGLALLKRIEMDRTELVRDLTISQKIDSAMRILNEFTTLQKDMLGSDLVSVASQEAVAKYVADCIDAGKPIQLNFPVCPTRWPKRLSYATPQERADFFDTNPVMADAVVLIMTTQEFARRLRRVGVEVKAHFVIFATDESDYIRIPEMDPWRMDLQTRQLLYRNLQRFQRNLGVFLKTALADGFGGCRLNIDSPCQNTSVIRRINKFEKGIAKEGRRLEVMKRLIEDRTSSRLAGFCKGGFYYSAAEALEVGEISREQARKMALRQIAAYRVQFQDLSADGIAVDNTTRADSQRMAMLRSDDVQPIINIYPCDRSSISKIFTPML